MSGRHRQDRITPARRALLGTVPLVGGAGVVGGVLVGAPPQAEAPAPAADSTPVASGVEPTASVTVPGRGETAMDAVAGARDAATAEQSDADVDTVLRVSTVAQELREQAEVRAERARAAGDAELAAFHRDQAQAQERAERTSRPVVGTEPEPGPDVSGLPDTDPGDTCTSADLLRLGPLTVAGPDDPECEVDPWVADQLAERAG